MLILSSVDTPKYNIIHDHKSREKIRTWHMEE